MSVKSVLLTVVCVLAVYLLVSAIVPPLFQKAIPPEEHRTPAQSMTDPGEAVERVRCVDDNTEALVWRLRIIEEAQEKLIFATFSYQDDQSGRDMMAALLSAADRGVDVRMVVDGFSAFTALRGSDAFQALAASENVTVKIYNPVNFLKPWKLNYRMHDKYVVADDKVYILGGRNTKNLSLGDYQEKKDIDRDVVVFDEVPGEQSSLSQVQRYFGSIWALEDTRPCPGKADEKALQELRERAQELRTLYPEAFEPTDWRGETMPAKGITLLHNPIEAGNKRPELWDTICALMETDDLITVQTPYLICNQMMYDGIARQTAAGRRVQIVTNAVESGGNPWGCADFLNQKKKIRGTGAEIYEYVGDWSAHAKTVLVGDDLSLVGSFNFDMRSAYLDTELMLLIQSEELNTHLRKAAQYHIDHSRCISADGTELYGREFIPKEMPLSKKIIYSVLRVVILPLRHLL